MRFDDLEKVAFDKEAGGWKTVKDVATNLGTYFRAGASVHAPVRGALQVAGGALKGAGNVAEYATRPVRSFLGAGIDKANQAATVVGKTVGGAALAAGSLAAGTASGIGRGVIEGAALPAGRWAANRFAKAPVATTMGLVGASGAASNVGDIMSGRRYDFHRMNPQLSTPASQFGVERYNPITKYSEESMPRRLCLRDLEKVASAQSSVVAKSSLPFVNKGTLSHLLTDKLVFPMATALMAPFFTMIGQKAVNHAFSPETRMDSEGIKAKGMAEYQGKEDIKKIEAKKKESEGRPKMNEIFAALRKQDKVIHEAYQDPHLKNVLHNTMETVFAFAPDVAKDHRTMQSVLREAITAPDGGLSFQTAKQLAETQKFISESKGPKR